MDWKDTIVEEVRHNREKLLKESGGYSKYVEKLKKGSKSSSTKISKSSISTKLTSAKY